MSVPLSFLSAALFLFLLAGHSSAQNAVAVTTGAGDESVGSLGWAVTALNNDTGGGTVTFQSNYAVTLSQVLPSLTQSVTFAGGDQQVIGQNESQSQFLFQGTLNQQNNLSFQNNGILGLGLDVSVTAASWIMGSNSTGSIVAASAPDTTTTSGVNITVGNGGNVSAEVGNWTIGGSETFNSGNGGNVNDTNGSGDVGGVGGSVSLSGTNLTLLGPSYFEVNYNNSGGIGGNVTDLGSTTTSVGGQGGAASVSFAAVSIGTYGNIIIDGGEGGYAVTGGAGGAASFTAGSLISNAQFNVQGGTGRGGISASGRGGDAAVSFGSYSGLSGASFQVAGGSGGSSSFAAAGGNALVSGGSATLQGSGSGYSIFLVNGGNGGNAFSSTAPAAGGNGGNVSMSLSNLSIISDTTMSVISGNGGIGASGATPGAGGAAGNTTFSLGTFSVGVSTTISLSSGNGGGGGSSIGVAAGGAGGAGGNLGVTLGTLTLGTGSNLFLDGGAGAAGGGSSGGTGGNGGAGGNVSLAIGAVTMGAGNELAASGGTGGIAGSGISPGTAGAAGQDSVSIGDLEGQGLIQLPNSNSLLQIASGSFGGQINGTGGTLEKIGSAALTLFGPNSYGGGTSVVGGLLCVNTGGTLGSGLITNSSLIYYINSATASGATILNNNAVGWVEFFNSSTASNAFITNDNMLNFNDSSSSGSATILNSGLISFTGSSTAGDAVITTVSGGKLFFEQGPGTAGGGGTAQLITNGTGFTDFSYDANAFSGPVTVGSIAGTGTYYLGYCNLVTGTNNLSTTVSGLITDGGQNGGTGASLTKVGTGTLSLMGANTFTGGTAIDGGTLAVGNSQALGTVGSVVVNGGILATAGAPLTFQVDGNYYQASGGTLQLGLGGAGASSQDRVNVTGFAILNGTLNLLPGSGLTAPTLGSKMTILDAKSVSGIFQQVDEGLTGIRLLPLYFSNAVELESINPSFQGSGTTPNQKSIGADLDTIALNPKVDGFMASIGVLSNTSLQAAEGQLSPEDFTALYQAGFEGALARTALVDQRMSQLMNDVDNTAWLPGFSSTGTLWFAGNMPASKEAAMAPSQTSPWGGFVSGNGGFFNVSSDSNAAGYKVTTYGLTGAGADYRLSREMVAGLMVGYGHTDVILGTGGTLTADGGQLGLYGLFYSEGFYTSALVEGGINSYGTTRTGYNGTATGKTQGNQYDGALEMGYQFKSGQMKIGPMGSVQYSDVSMNSFTEQGSQAPLTIPNQSENSLLSRLGARANSQWSLGNDTTLNPMLQLAWEHEYNYQGGTYQAGFGTGDSFTVAGPQVGQDGIMAGAGVGLSFAKSLTVSLDYEGEFGRTNLNSNQFGGGVKVGF